MEQQSKIKFLVDLLFTVTIGLIIFICGKFLLGYLLPFVIATVIAWWVQIPARKIAAKTKIKINLCAPILAAVVFLIAAALIIFIIYRLAITAGELLDRTPETVIILSEFVERLKLRFGDFLNNNSPDILGFMSKVGENFLATLSTGISNILSSFAATVAKTTPSFLFSCIVALVASCYIAKDYEILVKFIKELSGKNIFSKITQIKEIVTHSVFKLIKGYAILMLITFVELTVGFLILGIKNPVLLAVLISFIDLLPVFGTGTVLIPWGLIALALGDSKGVGIIILYIIITFVRNFSEPKIIGGQIGINPLFTLLVMFAGLKIMGFWGLIIFPLVFIVTIKYYKRQMQIEKNGI